MCVCVFGGGGGLKGNGVLGGRGGVLSMISPSLSLDTLRLSFSSFFLSFPLKQDLRERGGRGIFTV